MKCGRFAVVTMVAACASPPAATPARAPDVTTPALAPPPRAEPAPPPAHAPEPLDLSSPPPPCTSGNVAAARARELATAAWDRHGKALWDGEALWTPEDAPSEQPFAVAVDKHCWWRVDIVVERNGLRTWVGAFEVDSSDEQLRWRPHDGRDERWELAAYITARAAEREVLAAVRALPDVERFCKKLRREHDLGCVSFIDQRSAGACAAGAAIHDDCMFRVYVGEQHETHAARFAGFIVEPARKRVVGATDPGCGDMPLAAWRRYRDAWRAHAERGAPEPSDCPAP